MKKRTNNDYFFSRFESFLTLERQYSTWRHRVKTLNSVRKKHGTFLVECVHQCSKPWTRRRCTTYITLFHALCAEWHFGAETIFWIISEKFTIKLTSLVSSFTMPSVRPTIFLPSHSPSLNANKNVENRNASYWLISQKILHLTFWDT